SLMDVSSLQLPLELLQEPPVGTLADDPLRRASDDPGFVQPEGVEAHRVLGIVVPPSGVGQLFQRLQRIVVARGVPPVHQAPGDPFGLARADVVRLQDRPHGSRPSPPWSPRVHRERSPRNSPSPGMAPGRTSVPTATESPAGRPIPATSSSSMPTRSRS